MAGKGGPAIKVEGYRELQREIKKAVDDDLPKRLGQVNKDIGALVISKLNPPAVGEGTGARVRPSATRREVILRVGGSHRNEKPRVLQWGKTQEWPESGGAPERPDILGAATQHQAEIEEKFLAGIEAAMKPPFL